MDQDNLSQSQRQEEGSRSRAEASAPAQASASDGVNDPTASQPPVPSRPPRPQRSPRIEGSVDIPEPTVENVTEPKTEPETEPETEPAPQTNENETTPDSSLESQPSSSIQTEEHSEPSVKAGPKGPVRAASVPQPSTSRSVSSHLNPHAQRALSLAGTADSLPQVQEEFRVHIITWNVGSATPPDDITTLLGLDVGDGNTDMYIIGLQEVNSMINKRLKDVLFTDQWSEVCMERLSPFGYVLVTSQRMQGLILLVFAKYYHLPFLRGVQTETTRTGMGGYWGNKGGISARMTVFGHSICFLNCHLPAHMENQEERMEDFESILQQQQFDSQATTGVLDHDLVFWFGDLNFRIESLDIQVVKSAIENNRYTILWEKDQLNMTKDSEPVLEGFQEGPLRFPPTYKFDVGTNTYDTSGKKRTPAWTDRILWRLRATAPAAQKVGRCGSVSGLTSGIRVTQHCYRSHMEYLVSDHKPVSSIFTLEFPFRVDIPLVTLTVEDEWKSAEDAKVIFKLMPNYHRSGWDWIGLYKVGFKHHKDYVGYMWAKHEEESYYTQEHQINFPDEELPKFSGDFILGYYSNSMNTIVGVTEPFQILLPTVDDSGSSSDSSDYSSENDSTVVVKLLSRSPSMQRSSFSDGQNLDRKQSTSQSFDRKQSTSQSLDRKQSTSQSLDRKQSSSQSLDRKQSTSQSLNRKQSTSQSLDRKESRSRSHSGSRSGNVAGSRPDSPSGRRPSTHPSTCPRSPTEPSLTDGTAAQSEQTGQPAEGSHSHPSGHGATDKNKECSGM
ncbi:inositol polyphosphate 5-phosphatase K isoform X1 [Gambusia affinis]|uniref:inositol polyphosphate 5-phosphatase K isoform X1 n=1 Tax=Gambusia affinis TaxID=33528 RepID=UPI001CDCFD93|nr:inositol polyphosphate 5-phosphatase K isoform X1 [Gambusia affinis]XP_043967840.1 inositol polyphosphate 5-phosphatase K isoform X1 [Gambusia affinis]XP_043967841.1 inositol polyphosphate 5-phosphatase K isoform X1 [Gambusia affinis]XP_043967842.1 inositol polyphosphate 5-phosphatase K isoform X1 [Gambusia affinis]